MNQSGTNPPIPRTQRGIPIYPREYVIWTRGNLQALTQKLNQWVNSLKKNPISEFLIRYTPELILYRHPEPNNYLLSLSHVSSREVREQFYSLLIDLKNNNIIKPREGSIEQNPFKPNVSFDLTNDSKHKKLHAMLTESKSRQDAYTSETSTITHLMEQNMEVMRTWELPLLSKEDEILAKALEEQENTPPRRKRKAQEDLQDMMEDIQKIDWNQPMEGEYRTKISQDLPTQLKGLPKDKKTWTPGDWKRAKMINQHRSSHSSSEKNQSQKQQEEDRSSPVRITVTTGTSPSKASPIMQSGKSTQLQHFFNLQVAPASKQESQRLLSLLQSSSTGFSILSDTVSTDSRILVLCLPHSDEFSTTSETLVIDHVETP